MALMNRSTFGSLCTMSASACWCAAMPSNEMSCAASVRTLIWSRSSDGMNPFGIFQNR